MNESMQVVLGAVVLVLLLVAGGWAIYRTGTALENRPLEKRLHTVGRGGSPVQRCSCAEFIGDDPHCRVHGSGGPRSVG